MLHAKLLFSDNRYISFCVVCVKCVRFTIFDFLHSARRENLCKAPSRIDHDYARILAQIYSFERFRNSRGNRRRVVMTTGRSLAANFPKQRKLLN